jgi:periplasmic copper chaperone A
MRRHPADQRTERPRRAGPTVLAIAAAVALLTSCTGPAQGTNNPPGTNVRVDDIAIRYAHLEDPDAPGTGYRVGDDIPLYLWFVNESADEAALTDVSSPVATGVSLDGGRTPVELPTDTLVDLGPDGPHFVLEDITTQVRGAEFIPVDLTFSDGTVVQIMVEAIEVGPLD